MSFSSKQYAKALYEMLEGASQEEIPDIINGFAGVISDNKDSGKSEEIIEEFKNIWNKEKGVVEAEVTSVHELNEGMIEVLREYVATVTGASEVTLNQKVDEDILGGVVIKYEDKILDASLKKELQDLKKQMKK